MDKTLDRRILIAKKILHIGPDIEGRGGMAEVLRLHKNHVFKDCNYDYLKSNSRKGSLAGLYNLILLFIKLPTYRIKGKKIVHVHITVGKSFYRKSLISAFAKLLRYKVILHWHGGKAQDFFKKVFNRKIFSFLVASSEGLIVLSPGWENYFSSITGRKMIFIVPNPVILPPFPPNKVSSKAKMLFLGRFCYSKGIYDLIEACKNLNNDDYDFDLFLCGDREIKKVRNLISRYCLENRIHLLNWVEGKEKEKILQDSNIIILPSYAEAFPVSLLEGMGHGLTVISSKVGGIPDLVKPMENGFLIEPGNVKQLEEAIKFYILHPEKISEHGMNSYKKIKNYHPSLIRKTLFEIYENIAE